MQLSEVRPNVLEMPKSGFELMTGGSAKRRVVKPSVKQTATTTFPIQTHYKVTGVPGHTHNSSAVLSLLLDLKRTRGVTHTIPAGWAYDTVEHKENEAGDSLEIENDSEIYQRSLERGIGDICMRPENCHQEIREPVRSIGEVRRLVAPDDRIKTMTYVEEVGGYVTTTTGAHTTRFVSDYPDVLVNILGEHDVMEAVSDGVAAPNDKYNGKEEFTPALLRTDAIADPAHKTIVILDDNGVGTLEDGSIWNGIVRFKWDHVERLYKSEKFKVTLRRVQEVLANRGDLQAGGATITNLATLNIEVAAIKTTVAYNGQCYLVKPGITKEQAFVSNNTDFGDLKGRPEFRVSCISRPQALVPYFLVGTTGVRIKVGGTHALYGPNRLKKVTNPNQLTANQGALIERKHYFERLRFAKDLGKLTPRLRLGQIGTNGAGGGYDFGVANQYAVEASKYGKYGEDLEAVFKSDDFPMYSAKNSERGMPFYGLINEITIQNGYPGMAYDDTPLPVAAGSNQHGNSIVWRINPVVANITAAWAGRNLAQLTMTGNATKTFAQNHLRPSYYNLSGDPTDVESFESFIRDRIIDGITDSILAYNAVEHQRLRAIPAEHNKMIQTIDNWYITANAGKLDVVYTGTDVAAAFAAQNLVQQRLCSPQFTVSCYDETNDAHVAFTSVTAGGITTVTHSAATIVSVPFTIFGEPVLAGNTITTSVNIKPVFLRKHGDLFPYSVKLVEDRRAANLDNAHVDGANVQHHIISTSIGNLFDCKIGAQVVGNNDTYDANQILRPAIVNVAAIGVFSIQNLSLEFEENHTFFMLFNDIGTQAAPATPTCYVFHSRDCTTEFHKQGNALYVRTDITHVYTTNGDQISRPEFTAMHVVAGRNSDLQFALLHMGPRYQDQLIGTPSRTNPMSAITIFDDIVAESIKMGPVFQSEKRISQHICAPILNPNARIGCKAPLNFETMHLPPELRDFKLELRNMDFSFLPGPVAMQDLVLYEFNGGNQVVAAKDSLLHLPQFREMNVVNNVLDGSFDFEMYSPYGMPSFIAIYARDQERSNDNNTQPLIRQLNIMLNTTMKKSNTILEADVHQLYHITQRNVHARARYDRFAFNNRQVVLLSAEDIGLMGLDATAEFQRAKRSVFRFSGHLDQIARITVLLIYNNRGLYIHGKQLSVVRV